MPFYRKLGIIGVGPRGGYALEKYIEELVERDSLRNIHVSLFEHTGEFGNGNVYSLKQSSANWMNLNERLLELDERKEINTDTLYIKSFPSYHEWNYQYYGKSIDVNFDSYPPRAKIGKYLYERFESLTKPLIEAKIVSLHTDIVKEITLTDNNKIAVETNGHKFNDFDELLLTIGHQDTVLDKQIKKWENFANYNEAVHLFETPYPISNFLKHEFITPQSKISIRGFGLAMLDVTRAIAEKFGMFKPNDVTNNIYTYQSKHSLKDMIIPFSIDGLPPVPKPLNVRIDKHFKPSKSEIETFQSIIGDSNNQKQATDTNFLIDAFKPIAAHIYKQLNHTYDCSTYTKKELEDIAKNFLLKQSYAHPLLVSQDKAVKDSLHLYIGMALGIKPISYDYCIMQVWRHCQTSIYESLSFNECKDEVFAEIIKLDESTKRYTFGPPVEGCQQLLSLIDAGVMNVNFCADPNINESDSGWKFEKNNKSIRSTVMIDSVLDAPQIKKVNTSIIKHLLEDDLLQAVHSEFGVVTDKNAYLISKKNHKLPIALLGRLAKGTIIGVDAILECFGERPHLWAIEAASNHQKYLNS